MKKLVSDHITIENTNICNAKCLICPREKYHEHLQVMDMALWKKIIDDAAQYNISMLDLCGYGEPFADEHFFERCKYAKEKIPGLKIYVSTNCSLMTRSTLDDVCKYIDILKISFYGVTSEVYSKCHGGLEMGTTLVNIMRLMQRPDRPRLIALFSLIDENKSQMDDWISFWEPLCDEVMVWTPHNWAGLRDYRPLDHSKQRSCGRPFKGPLYIHVDGTASMCCWDINKKLVIGDMKTDTIYDAFHSEAFNTIQEKHKAGDFEGLLCYGCEQTNDFNGLVYSNNNAQPGILTVTKDDLLV